MYPQTFSEAFQSHPPLLCLVEEGGGTQLESDLSACSECNSVLHLPCTKVNDYMRYEAVENQAPEGFLQDGK